LHDEQKGQPMADRIEQTPASATFVLTAGLVFALKQIAAARGVSVSELAREYLTAGVVVDAVAA
jgi:hypothetical protein